MPFLVKPKLGVCFSCCDSDFTLTDNTGPWDATLNPYGWAADGSGDNIEIADVETSSLSITAPDGTVYGPYDILASLPSLTGTTLEVDPTDIFGSGDSFTFVDGVYTFDWTVTGVYGVNDTPFTARCVKEVFPLCAVQCCVDKLASKSSCKCGKGDNKATDAYLTLVAAQGAWSAKRKEDAKGHLANLQDICNNNCKNC